MSFGPLLLPRRSGQNSARLNLERAILDMRTRATGTDLLKLGSVAKEPEQGEVGVVIKGEV